MPEHMFTIMLYGFKRDAVLLLCISSLFCSVCRSTSPCDLQCRNTCSQESFMASGMMPCSSSMYILSLLFCLQVHQFLLSPMLEHMFTIMLYGFRRDACSSSMYIPLSSVLSAGPPVPVTSNAGTHVHNNALWLQAWCPVLPLCLSSLFCSVCRSTSSCNLQCWNTCSH